MNTSVYQGDGPQVMDARGVLLLLFNRRLWILISTITFAALFAAVAFLSTPRYRASTVLIPASRRNMLGVHSLPSALGGGLASLAGLSVGGANPDTQEALGVLRSRAFTQDFIQRNNLLPVLFSSKWNASTGKWRVPKKEQPTLQQAFKYFNRSIRTISDDRETGLITLQIEWRNRIQAADWANEMVQQLNATMRKRAIKMADASIGYLESAYKSTALMPTQQAITQLLESQIDKRMVATVTPQYAFRVVSPALPSDKDDPVWPRKLLLLVLGPFSGFLAGTFLVLIYEALFGQLSRTGRDFPRPNVRESAC